jgi:hypothetical protein
MLTRKCGMTKPMLNGERGSKPLANILVTTRQEQGWSERTPLSAISATKDQNSMTLGKLTTSTPLTPIAH